MDALLRGDRVRDRISLYEASLLDSDVLAKDGEAKDTAWLRDPFDWQVK